MNAEHMAKRALKNSCLQYLVYLDLSEAVQQLNLAHNMTDALAALRALNRTDNPAREDALAAFYQKWQHENLVLDKWFAIQALANVPQTFETVKQLMQHPAFDLKNPNKVSALLMSFSRNNPYYFHQSNGAVYTFFKEVILKLDALNPQVSARVAQVFTHFKRYDDKRCELMRNVLQAMQQMKLSNDLYEIVNKSLNE
jgi:aminopeptidase N